MSSTVARAGSTGRAAVRPAARPGASEDVASPSSRRRAVPLALGGIGVVLALAAVVIVTADRAWGLPSATELPVDVAIAVVYTVTGAAVMAARHGTRRLGAILLVAGLASALTALATAVALTAREVTPLAVGAVWLQSWLWVVGTAPLVSLVPLLYPDGRLPGRRWWPVAVAAVAGTVLLSAGVATFPEPFEGRLTIERPLTSEAVARPLVAVGAPLLIAAVVAAFAGLVVRLRRTSGLARRQVVVLLAAVAVLVAHTLLIPFIPAPWDAASQAVAVSLVPLAIGVAVTRHRLYDLDIAVCRGLVGVSLALCIAGVYATLAAVAHLALGAQPVVSSAIAAGASGLLVHPLAVRLSRGVDRLFYGDRADTGAVLARMSARLGDGLDVRDVPQVVCDTVIDTLRLGSARLDVVVGGRPTVAATAGDAADADREVGVDLRHRGQTVGRLVVTPRPGEAAVHPRDRELVGALAGQVAPSVAAIRLHQELQRSRESLVTAREEERRRLRRELHDGVGAALAGVRLQVDSAHDMVEDSTARRMLEVAANGIAEAVGDVRALTDDLRPPALDELGLVGSLRALGERSASPTLRVDVDVPPLPTLPAATEVAVHRVVAEALANAVRHARATRVGVTVRTSPGELVLVVADDGRGPGGAERDGGVGVPSMRHRAEELGGWCDVRPGPDGGTVVEVRLPWEAP